MNVTQIIQDGEIFDKDGKTLHIADVIGSYIIAKAEEMKCDLDETTIAVDDGKLVITGFYYMHEGEQFCNEVEIPFNWL